MHRALLVALLVAGCVACGAAPGAPGDPGAAEPVDPGDPGAAEPGGDEAGAAEPGAPGTGETLCPEPAEGATGEMPPGCEPLKEQDAELVTPQPGAVDASPRPWERAEAVGDGSTLRITYTSGVEPCYVLDRVEVEEQPDAVTVTLYEGSDPTQPDAVCIQIAKTKVVEVELSAPLGDRPVIDGAAQDPGAG